MLYSEQLTYYRNQFKKHLDARDSANAKRYAILYANLVRELRGCINSYTEKALLADEAQKYDVFAAMITKYGITDDVKVKISNGNLKTSLPSTSSETSNTLEGSAKKTTSKSGGTKKAPKISPTSTHQRTSAAFAPASVSGDVAFDDLDWCADVFEKYSPATLVIRTATGVGTGFFVTSDGYLITNHHVVYNDSEVEAYIRVKSGDGKIESDAEIIHADKKHDLALLKLKNFNSTTPFIPIIEDYRRVRPGIAMVLIGNGLNCGLAPVSGNVKFACSSDNDNLVFTAPSNPGDSGAPVFNREGECIGIHKSATVGKVIGGKQHIKATGLSNATSADNIRKLFSKWGLEGKV